ncbi:uncharacterized transporter Mb2022c [Arthrobacter sp. Hiyo8]|nr:uncharacterized transporter Mb2022c [Arthrobacter sp. Hiyo8]
MLGRLCPSPANIPGDGLLAHGWYGILQSAGLLFFAFAGYARIATMGEEVRDPAGRFRVPSGSPWASPSSFTPSSP